MYFRLSSLAQDSIANVFCKLLQPTRTDVVVGHWQLAELLERFVFTYLIAEDECDTCCHTLDKP